MCGIVGICSDRDGGISSRRAVALEMASKVRHRGPDWSGIYADDRCILAHERLSIVDVETGSQPLHDRKTGRVLVANGEIYNHTHLRKMLKKKHDWQTRSDCEVLLYLYDEYGHAFLGKLDGIFAFVIYDSNSGDYFIARDHIGIVPLYMGWDEKGTLYIASEMKALDSFCPRIKEFPPGHYLKRGMTRPQKWYRPAWIRTVPGRRVSAAELRKALEDAVKSQMMSDVPYGVLISGGLDSSIIAAIASKYRKKRVESGDTEEAWWPRLHSFSVGLKGSPDLKYARRVADYLGTVHHEITFTIQEGFDAIRDVIYHLETFDVTTIRAGTPMYLMARKIRSMGIKMILSGEGADEVFGGYLYFHMAPGREEFHRETVRKLSLLSKYDCLRANKAMAAWGVEARVPFLDRFFLDVAMSMDPAQKMCGSGRIEKEILRKAFRGYIPDEILYRQKEQFSDGVGYGWIDYLKHYAGSKVTDAMMASAKERFPVRTPLSKEEYLYRSIFDSIFTSPDAATTVPTGPTIACSTSTAYKWSENFKGFADPSGRAVKDVHRVPVSAV
ncbi:MAG: asparagine synthase B [Candidatus Aenigmarchaeota archaeon]|nr:asparagine synthase B [Candidatus Aenigmarchaeota archaeon]